MSKAETLIERLTDAVAAHYAGDPSAAGLVVARLPNGQAYVSVVRYRGSHGQGKEVVTAAQRPTLREALIVVAEAWHRIASKGQKDVADVAELVQVMKPANQPPVRETVRLYRDKGTGIGDTRTVHRDNIVVETPMQTEARRQRLGCYDPFR